MVVVDAIERSEVIIKPKYKIGDKVELYDDGDKYANGVVEKLGKIKEEYFYVVSLHDPELYGALDFGWAYCLEKDMLYDFGEIKEGDFEYPFFETSEYLDKYEWSWKNDQRTNPKSKSKDHSVYYKS